MGLHVGAKSAALLAAPGVLNPTAFLACINILHVLTRGGGYFKIVPEILPSWDYVGTFSVLGRFFFALGCLFTPCWAFVAHAGRFLDVLGRSGSDFGLS